MKNIVAILLMSLFVFNACKKENTTKKEDSKNEEIAVNYSSFGDKISTSNSISASEMYIKYNSLEVGDTLNVKFSSTINDVCSKKGCWMKLPLNHNDEAMVRFKNYGFFMPLDSKNKEVIVEGKAFVKETSVDELKHYAEDAGKSKEEIAKITQPKIEFAFEANGVLLKK